ncbi:DUF4976 domain-containing protein [Labilibacter sediminis]|nr:DUF4976 domain-containing protein [Labilibacter sediminis]
MKLRNITIGIRICLFFLFVGVSANAQQAKDKPNIIFLFADDQCYNTVNALGNKEIKTPNLDKMVEDGATFTHAYNMGAWNGAVCAASRAMINTGRFVWRAYEVDGRQQELVKREEMWGQLMQQAGYTTYMSGKWHVKAKPEQLFNKVVHMRKGMPSDNWKQFKAATKNLKSGEYNPEEYMPFGYNRSSNTEKEDWKPWDKSNGGYWEEGKHFSEILGDDAIDFIDEAKSKDEPFFMYLAFNAPHDPRQSPKEFVDMYPLDQLSVPETFIPEYPYKDKIGCGQTLRDEALAPFPRTEAAVKTHKQEYYAIITHLDQQIGRIMKALEESGKLDNTYIFYTADHGLAMGNHGLLGKQSMYDHSMRAPLFVIGPDVPKNKKFDVDVYLQDIMASTVDLAGIPKPEYIEFNSLMPIVRGEQKKSSYDAIYGCYQINLQRMIRKDGYKLIVYPQAKTVLLYDLEKDPKEMNDISKEKKNSKKVKKLFADLVKLQEEMDDPLDLVKLFPQYINK